VWVGYLWKMCGENVYSVDRSAFGTFVTNLMFYLHIYRVAAVGVWCGVFVSPFCNPWRRCVDVLVVGVCMKYRTVCYQCGEL
jgi:hypothetical protein